MCMHFELITTTAEGARTVPANSCIDESHRSATPATATRILTLFLADSRSGQLQYTDTTCPSLQQ